LWTSRSSAGGASERNCVTDGSDFSSTAAITRARLAPSNAGRPVNISNSTAPNANTSDVASASLPSSCSGAM
jgi:hypothetical protein